MCRAKFLTRLAIGLTFLLSLNAVAEEESAVVIETEPQNIRLADDGTGIVKNIFCTDCDFKVVKVTPASKATRQGVEVNILEVRGLKDIVVMVSFDRETQEVEYIRW